MNSFCRCVFSSSSLKFAGLFMVRQRAFFPSCFNCLASCHRMAHIFRSAPPPPSSPEKDEFNVIIQFLLPIFGFCFEFLRRIVDFRFAFRSILRFYPHVICLFVNISVVSVVLAKSHRNRMTGKQNKEHITQNDVTLADT